MLPVRKEDRPHVSGLLVRRIEDRHRRRGPACRRHPPEAAIDRRREQNHAVAVPVGAPAPARIAEGRDLSAGEGYPLQATLRKESDRQTIGRPERPAAAFGPRQRPRHECVELAQPELLPPVGAATREHQTMSVRRQRKRGTVDVRRQGDVRRRRNREATSARLRGRAADRPQRQASVATASTATSDHATRSRHRPLTDGVAVTTNVAPDAVNSDR